MSACVLAVLLALSGAGPADPQLARLLGEKASPGSIALLVRYAADPAASARLAMALRDAAPSVRATAARVALVAYARTLRQDLAEALAAEDNSEAAREEIRALITLGGPDGDPQLFEASRRFEGRLDWDIAETLARVRGTDAIPILLVDARLKLTATQWVDAFFLAARGDAALVARALGQALQANEAKRWETLLREAKARKVEIDQSAVAAGLDAGNARIAGTSAWFLSARFAASGPQDAAALSRFTNPAPGTDPDTAFAMRLLGRALGSAPADDAAWIAWLEDAKTSLADSVSPGAPVLVWLTPAEREALRHRYDRRQSVKVQDDRADRARWEPRTPAPQPPPRIDLLQMRTVADLPRGVAAGVLTVSGCAAKPGKPFALAEMHYNPDGRPSRLTPIDTPSSPACNDAAMSLFLLTLAPDSEFPIVNRSVVLIAISRSDCLAALDEADVCPSVCPDDRTAVFRVSGHVEPPVIDQRVEPAYPEGARRERVEGPVTIEAVITEEGCIKGVRVLKTLDPRLDFEAARAVSQWKYRPAHLDGRPVSVYLTVNVTYALKK